MLAIIPARGGSKGLPGKNIRPLCGKPLIAYSIEAALNSEKVSRVILSTDSEEIAEVGKQYGAEVPFLRPPELATDEALAIDNYVYTVERLNEMGADIQELVVLLPTAPLRNSGDVDKAIEIFENKEADSVVSYYPAHHPIEWYQVLDENGVLRPAIPQDDFTSNRQQARECYLPNGAIYVFRFSLLKNENKYYSDKSYPYLMAQECSIDIDRIEDFEAAEHYLCGK